MIEVIEAERRLIFSEKQAVLEENLRLVEEGSIYDGTVNSVTDFGAFVDIVLPDGTPAILCCFLEFMVCKWPCYIVNFC